jgi:hypothetical protein
MLERKGYRAGHGDQGWAPVRRVVARFAATSTKALPKVAAWGVAGQVAHDGKERKETARQREHLHIQR